MAQMNRTDYYLTSRELARLLNVHINTVRRWSDRGVLKAYRFGPRGDRRFSKESVARFLAESEPVAQKPEEERLPVLLPVMR
jgi:excisionase family DNA binding protein